MENIETKKCIPFTFTATGYKPLTVFSKFLFVLFVIALIVAVISFIVAIVHTGGETWEERSLNNSIQIAAWISLGYSLTTAFVIFLQVIMLNVIRTILHTQILHRAVLEDKYNFVED